MKHTMQTMRAHLRLFGVEDACEQWQFALPRKWAFDFCWPDRMVAFELEGITPTGGRHQRPKGYSGDCEKYTEAALRGWTLIRATPRQVASGQALAWLLRALGVEGGVR